MYKSRVKKIDIYRFYKTDIIRYKKIIVDPFLRKDEADI